MRREEIMTTPTTRNALIMCVLSYRPTTISNHVSCNHAALSGCYRAPICVCFCLFRNLALEERMSAAEQSIEKAETQLKDTVDANKVHIAVQTTTASYCEPHTPTYCHIARRSDYLTRFTLYLPLRTTISLNLKLNPMKRT